MRRTRHAGAARHTKERMPLRLSVEAEGCIMASPAATEVPTTPVSAPDSPLTVIATPSPVSTPSQLQRSLSDVRYLPSPEASAAGNHGEASSDDLSTLSTLSPAQSLSTTFAASPNRGSDTGLPTSGFSLVGSSPVRSSTLSGSSSTPQPVPGLPTHLRQHNWAGNAKVRAVRGTVADREILVSFNDIGNDAWWVSLASVPASYRRIAIATANRIARVASQQATKNDSEHDTPAGLSRRATYTTESPLYADRVQRQRKRRFCARTEANVRARQDTPACSEHVGPGSSHGGAVHPCSVQHAHEGTTAVDESSSSRQHMVCTTCHDGHYETVWTEQEKKELIRAGMLGVSVGCRALCPPCGKGTLDRKGFPMPAAGKRWGTCDCLTYTGAWACGGCRIEEIERSLAWKKVAEGMAGAVDACGCGRALTGQERVWECLWCHGLVVTTGIHKPVSADLTGDASAIPMLWWHGFVQGGVLSRHE